MSIRLLAAQLLVAMVAVAVCASAPAADKAEGAYTAQPYVRLSHPEWSKNAVLYQLNTRQFTAEGTLRAAEKQLPRLKELGASIIWLMPIHPIGEQNRKGTLCSPYAVKDYYGVNPEFGTLQDLKRFVDTAHALGLRVILDRVANHTAWDNALQKKHPEWYERDYRGNFRPTPWWDWSDIIDLDYTKPGVREYMTEAMKYWVRDVGIDGYRCDVAGFVPLDFWDNVRRELDAIKPVFMLAEWESRDLHARAFDATHAWSWYDAAREAVNGEHGLNPLFVYYSWRESACPESAYRMTYVSNHDANAWEQTQFKAFGDGLEAAIVLSVAGDGIPMIYNGQEAGNPKQLAFFEKDPIEWRQHPSGDLYRRLFALKKINTALWNGAWGATMLRVWNTRPDEVLSFVRENDTDKVFAVINFSAATQTVQFSDAPFEGKYTEYFSGDSVTLDGDTALAVAPWAYRVFVRR